MSSSSQPAIRPLLIGAVLALAAALPGPAYADLWYEHYAAAEKALAEERWPEAIVELTSAIEKRGDSAARARTYGMKFTPYFPYLKLGVAYYELGQLEAALQAFETEERLGAIAGSESGRAQLARYRDLALAAQRSAAEEEAVRIRHIVEESLASAARREREDDVEGAIAALGSAIAVSPDDPSAQEALQRLRAKLAERQRSDDLRDRVASLVGSGRDLLARGLAAEASSVLRQALALEESPEARALLDEAQRQLRGELEAGRRARSVTEALAEARTLRDAGRLEEALERLQPVLALAPADGEAQALESTLLAEQARAEEARLRDATVASFLAAADAALAAGRFEEALTAANRVLAAEAGNEAALDQLARAYRAINRRVLGAAPRQRLPPAISFADRRRELADGVLAEAVASPEFRLTGVVIDDTAVAVEFFTAAGRPLAAAVEAKARGDLYLTEFRLSHELEPGTTTLRLVATDAENLTSSAEYTVVYARPLVRSPWLYGGLTLALALGAGGAAAVRARRLRRLRRRRFNPFVAGAPVLDGELFFGREQLLERILETLHNNSLLLHGERRIGKTSLQHQLKKRLEALDDPDYDFYPVYVDLQGTHEERFFATLGEEIFTELAPVLDDLAPSAPFTAAYTYRELVADLKAILKVLRRRGAKRVRLVLLIDEVDELNAYDPKVNQKLRGLFMKSFAEDLVAVVSGVAIKREWEREGSPWYNFFEEIDVGPLRLEHARELVEKPIRGVFRLEDGVVERVAALTGGRPYRIQRLCMNLVSRAHEAGSRRISVADVEAVGDVDSQGAA
ncbi:MAG: ATP-binding protein [Acidobacteriota bacterium]|nr:ATP-binding protein [Acidobacteriota bacterium]MDH3522633.1 ATP-binding protein [Acidobacteriota bacterium]